MKGELRNTTLKPRSVGAKVKICLVGERRVGKSSLVRRYLLDEFGDEYLATFGMKVYKKLVYVNQPGTTNKVPVTMVLWDIMGDQTYGDSLREIYLHGASGVMAVADVTEPRTVSPLNNWVAPSLQFLGDVPVQIVLNKWDAGESEFAVNTGRWVARKNLATCYLASASRGDNVELAFTELAQRILAQATLKSRRLSEDRMLGALVGSIGKRRSLTEISADLGEPLFVVEPLVRSLVRSGHLTLEDVEVTKFGSPVMIFSATGKLLTQQAIAAV